MSKTIRIFFTVVMLTCFTWLTSLTFANDLQAIPELNNPVMDTVNLLTPEEKATLNQYLYDFYQKNGSQIVILIVPTTGSENIFDYSSRVFAKWQIGRKEYSDGILIIVALNDRQMGIYPGSGLEGAVPDITAKRIINRAMKPHFQQGDYFSGLFTASQALEQLILGEELPEYTQPDEIDSSEIISFILSFLFLQYILFFFSDGFGKVFASCLSGGFAFGLAQSFGFPQWIVIGIVVMSVIITYFGLMSILINAFGIGNNHGGGSSGRGPGGFNGGGFGSGGFGGGSGGFGGGGFSGGGGGFSGGGASGGW
ncbi:MAG: TPM domain-containing protein [Neisseriaceae bacterium]|nr:TPM domain-containing protein [Neisseriaceae bacterium]